jgi:hypothetical protein
MITITIYSTYIYSYHKQGNVKKKLRPPPKIKSSSATVNDPCKKCTSLYVKGLQGCYAYCAYYLLQIYICTHSQDTHNSSNSYNSFWAVTVWTFECQFFACVLSPLCLKLTTTIKLHSISPEEPFNYETTFP